MSENLISSFFEFLNKTNNEEANQILEEVIKVFLNQDSKLSVDLSKNLPSSLTNKSFISEF